ncbi:MAG: type II toxin-antitoxin system HicB family antitoxin [Candidatus Aminicenantes bacterium]|nr:type II toxin-antitoxin system HicB family antitoxin [Candidatus Aminicenantes bacterium]
MFQIEFDGIIFKERETFIGYCPKLDVSSCGNTIDEARKNLKTAVRLFLEEAEKMGTLEDILKESGYEKTNLNHWMTPQLIATELMSLEA